MRAVSSAFAEAAASSASTTIARVTIGDTVLGPEAIQSIAVTQVATPEASFGVGNTPSAQAVLVLLTSALPLVFTASDISIEVGYVLGDNAEYTPWGVFGTNDSMVSDSGLFTTIEAHDAFYWMDGPMSKTWTVGTTVTTRQMMTDMLSGTSVEFDVTELPEVPLTQFRPRGTLRDCIGQVCAAAMMNAVFDGTGRLRFKKPTPTGMTFPMVVTPGSGIVSSVAQFNISSAYALTVDHVTATFTKTFPMLDTEDYEQPEDEEVPVAYPTDATGLAVGFGATSFSETGSFLYKSASDDGGLSRAKNDLSTIATRAKTNNLLPSSLRGFDLTLHGHPQMEVFDSFSVQSIQGITYDLTALSITYTYNGAIAVGFQTMASSSDTEVQTIGSAATIASITESINSIVSKNLALTNLTVQSLKGDNATFNTVIADKVSANEVLVNKVTANVIDAVGGEFDDIIADNATIKSILADTAKIHELTADSLSAATAYIDKLETNSVTADKVIANQGFFDTLGANSITADKIVSMHGAFEKLDANYAEIDFANVDTAHIDQAWIENLMVQGKMIVQEGTVFYLDAVEVNADSITAGTLKAKRLLLEGEDGLFHEINATVDGVTSEQLSTEEYQSAMHGSKIIAKSIVADKIDVADLSAFGATIGGFEIDEKSIHTTGKDSPESQAVGSYISSDGGVHFGSPNQYISFDPTYENDDGTIGRLVLKTSNIYLTGGLDMSDMSDNIKKYNLYMRFNEKNMELGYIGNPSKTLLTAEGMAFTNDNQLVTYIYQDSMYSLKSTVMDNLRLNNFLWMRRPNGNMSLKHVSGEPIPDEVYDAFGVPVPDNGGGARRGLYPSVKLFPSANLYPRSSKTR